MIIEKSFYTGITRGYNRETRGYPQRSTYTEYPNLQLISDLGYSRTVIPVYRRTVLHRVRLKYRLLIFSRIQKYDSRSATPHEDNATYICTWPSVHDPLRSHTRRMIILYSIYRIYIPVASIETNQYRLTMRS